MTRRCWRFPMIRRRKQNNGNLAGHEGVLLFFAASGQHDPRFWDRIHYLFATFMSPGRYGKMKVEKIKEVLKMKLLLKILVAPFALALSVLTALFMFLFDICAFLLTIASVILAVLGGCPLFHADAHRRDCIPVSCLPPFSLRTASCGVLDPVGTGRRQIGTLSVLIKLSSLGPCWPEAGAALNGPPFLFEGRDDFWQPQPYYSAMRAKAKPLPRPSGIVWTMVKTRRKQKAESISPLMSATRPPWRTSFFWQRPVMPP